MLITHSNQALNQLFEKIMQLDIDERHLLRLGVFTVVLEIFVFKFRFKYRFRFKADSDSYSNTDSYSNQIKIQNLC